MTTQANNVAIESSQINSSGVLQPAGGGTGVNITSSDLSVNGLTVGKGGGAVSTNTAVGASALTSNTTASNNTAVGYTSGYSNTTGAANASFGAYSLYNNTTGGQNTALGATSLYTNSTGSSNTAVGEEALRLNTTASNNTAVGYQAGYSNTTGGGNGGQNTFIGDTAGYSTTSDQNTFVGRSSGYAVTTGRKNTILGMYNGNQGGLDIRTASNYVVLSDGDGNVKGVFDNSGNFVTGGAVAYDYSVNGFGVGAGNTYSYFTRTSGYALLVNLKTTTGAMQAFTYNGSGVGNISTNGSNCTFNSTSDYRLKQNIQPMTGALAKVALLKPVTYNWIRENQAGEGFIAHELQEVCPEAVVGTKDAVDSDGNPVYQAIDQSVLVATLTAAIQELKAEFDAYKATHP